jgi:peptide/nickel transport system ATP-binding protein
MNALPQPLLDVQGLSIGFGKLDVVENVSFSIFPGEIVGIVGESGSGKSVTCRALMGLLPATATARGNVRLDGREVMALDEVEWRPVRGPQMAMIFQNPSSHLDPLRRIGDQIAAPMMRHQGLNRRDARRRAIELLADVGIREPEVRARSYPHEFSGGMKQRAMIAAALGCGPRLLIADEPTTALDVTVQARILSLLTRLNAERGLAIILISHDLGVIADVCSRVLVMRGGTVVEQGPVEQIIHRPRHPYTRQLIDSQPGRKVFAATKAEADLPLLEVENLRVSFPQSRGGGLRGRRQLFHALDGVSIILRAGETVGIVGESGSGKSTLARAIVRQNRPAGGTIRLDGLDVLALEGKALTGFRRRVQMVFQSPYDSLNPRMTAADAVAEPIWRHGLANRRAARDRAHELLDMVELPAELHERKPRQLSGGQCQRVGLARALALEPQMLIADEITSPLDVTRQAQIVELLTRLQRERELTLLYISHDLSVVSGFCRRVYVMKAGRVVETGPAAQVLSRPIDPYTQELVNSLPRLAPLSPSNVMAENATG